MRRIFNPSQTEISRSPGTPDCTTLFPLVGTCGPSSSGIYTTCNNPKYKAPLLKVIFPLPNGNASVIMRKEVLEDGFLLLSSDGQKFGDNGFYFTLTDHKGQYWAKFVSAMHEWIKVYEDEEGVLRADHFLNFYGVNFLKLHYKMTPQNRVANNVEQK